VGYYTWYQIAEVSGDSVEQFQSDFRNGMIDTSYGPLDEMFGSAPGPAHDSMKWYDHITDMCAVSVNYPNTLITIEGRGEDGEHWRAYHFNGEYETVDVEISFPAPSTSLLMTPALLSLAADTEDLPEEDY